MTTVPFIPNKPTQKVSHIEDLTLTELVTAPYFNVVKWQIAGRATVDATAPYTLATVVDGDVELTVFGVTYHLAKGISFILPNDVETWKLNGHATLITSTPGPKSL